MCIFKTNNKTIFYSSEILILLDNYPHRFITYIGGLAFFFQIISIQFFRYVQNFSWQIMNMNDSNRKNKKRVRRYRKNPLSADFDSTTLGDWCAVPRFRRKWNQRARARLSIYIFISFPYRPHPSRANASLL